MQEGLLFQDSSRGSFQDLGGDVRADAGAYAEGIQEGML